MVVVVVVSGGGVCTVQWVRQAEGVQSTVSKSRARPKQIKANESKRKQTKAND